MPTADKSPRSDLVRRRRTQTTRQRYQATAQAAGLTRPLVSRPRRVAGLGATLARPKAHPWRGRLPSITLPAQLAGWRLASFSLVVLLSAMLVRLMSDRAMYVSEINLGGAALVPGQEIYAASGVARQHIFWVDPVDAQRRVSALPGLATAEVSVVWPNQVTIVVKERVPVIAWQEGEQALWVDAEGRKFPARSDLPGLLPITVDPPVLGAPLVPAAEQVPLEAIRGALQLKELRANIELLHYDPLHGLSYQDGRGWRGYFGVGSDMAQKLAVYETLVDNLMARGVQPAAVSVENPLAPYYRR